MNAPEVSKSNLPEPLNFWKFRMVKLFRFASIYGIRRSLTKSFGRLRINFPLSNIFSSGKRYVSVIGCGQFSFSTICYFLQKNKGNIFLSCYDVNDKQSFSLKKFFNFKNVSASSDELINDNQLELLYIASNHYSHANYAVQGLNRRLTVYVEKPVAVNYDQFVELNRVIKSSNGKIFAGYNRPFSKAICFLKKMCNTASSNQNPFTINYFISGHLLSKDHWYRNPQEGTRICGNVGHWIDLTIHILSWRQLPGNIKVNIAYSDINEPDDNICITLTSDLNDLVTITLTSRCEPFEGINETINLQYRNVIAKIDDFRRLTVWQDEKLIRKNFYPKDVGHEKAIMQPFISNISRDWKEVELSTLLMLFITEMVVKKNTESVFDVKEICGEFHDDVTAVNLNRPMVVK